MDNTTERPSALQLTAVGLLLAAVAWTAFIGWPQVQALQQGVEAMESLGRIARGAAIYYVKPRGDEGGRMACQFPVGSDRVTTATSCCDPAVNLPGTRDCDPSKLNWNTPIWRALDVALDVPQPFVWVYEASGTFGAATYTISAYADLDCDGQVSTFRLVGNGDANAKPDDCVLRTTPELQVENPAE